MYCGGDADVAADGDLVITMVVLMASVLTSGIVILTDIITNLIIGHRRYNICEDAVVLKTETIGGGLVSHVLWQGSSRMAIVGQGREST